MEDFSGEIRMDTLPCLREQNEVADTERENVYAGHRNRKSGRRGI